MLVVQLINIPKAVKHCMNNIHEDILSSYYGCGLIIPDQLKNAKVMDLGCGTGLEMSIFYQN